MAKWIRNEYYKKLTYENLFKAHLLARKGKNYREELIKFNLKQEEYIMWLYEQLKNKVNCKNLEKHYKFLMNYAIIWTKVSLIGE